MTDFHGQSGRAVSTGSELTQAQLDSDQVDFADGLAGLSSLVSVSMDLVDLLEAVAGFAAQAIPGVDGAGVTVTALGGTVTDVSAWSATVPFVRAIDLIQYDLLREGPCITAMNERVPVISGSVASDQRWRRFGGRVARMGVASALALPLIIADRVVGSINCYAREADAFGEHAVRLGSSFARPAAVSVFNAQVLDAARAQADRLQRALDSRGVIDQAIGIIRARSGGTAEDGFDRLRRISQTENVKLHDVARELVEEAVRRARARGRTT